MPKTYLYYVPCVTQIEGHAGFHAHIVEMDGPINSVPRVWELIDRLTREVIEGEPDEGTLPVVPIGWTLINAHLSANPEDNGHKTITD